MIDMMLMMVGGLMGLDLGLMADVLLGLLGAVEAMELLMSLAADVQDTMMGALEEYDLYDDIPGC